LKIKYTSQFKKDYKKIQKQNKDINRLQIIIETLLLKQNLDEKYLDHPLSGDWKKYRECHIAPDWLLIYKIDDDYLILARTGLHADLFKM
jgi:mRNA interferase YafQ